MPMLSSAHLVGVRTIALAQASARAELANPASEVRNVAISPDVLRQIIVTLDAQLARGGKPAEREQAMAQREGIMRQLCGLEQK